MPACRALVPCARPKQKKAQRREEKKKRERELVAQPATCDARCALRCWRMVASRGLRPGPALRVAFGAEEERGASGAPPAAALSLRFKGAYGEPFLRGLQCG